MNFSSVPRTSSRVEDEGTFAEYRMSRNCAREPDAKRSYIKAKKKGGDGVPYFNNGIRVVGESGERGAHQLQGRSTHISSHPRHISKWQKVSRSVRKDWKEQTG